MLAGKRLSGGLAALGALTLVAAATAVAVGHNDQEGRETAIRAGLSDQRPKNVIFLLGDGMGVQDGCLLKRSQPVWTAQLARGLSRPKPGA